MEVVIYIILLSVDACHNAAGHQVGHGAAGLMVLLVVVLLVSWCCLSWCCWSHGVACHGAAGLMVLLVMVLLVSWCCYCSHGAVGLMVLLVMVLLVLWCYLSWCCWSHGVACRGAAGHCLVIFMVLLVC